MAFRYLRRGPQNATLNSDFDKKQFCAEPDGRNHGLEYLVNGTAVRGSPARRYPDIRGGIPIEGAVSRYKAATVAWRD